MVFAEVTMAGIPDFDNAQITSAQALLRNYFGGPVELHLADSEMPLSQEDPTLIACPILFWNVHDCNFAVLRLGEEKYCARFFYMPDEQQTTAQEVFNTVEDSINAVLRAQAADHEKRLKAAGYVAEPPKPA